LVYTLFADASLPQFIYLLARSLNAQVIVEAGTSYGVSTIYLAAAVRDNVAANGAGKHKPVVVGTEHESAKVQSAKTNLSAALDSGVFDYVDVREGDLRQTLPGDLPNASVNLVLLDIWTHMALPALKALHGKLAPGAVIIADNSKKAELSCNQTRALIIYISFRMLT
jgi:predicted O-methyltransferase YrrM